MFECERHILSNGLRVVAVPVAHAPTISVIVFVRGGSRVDSKEKMGLAHFMEHIFFKGGKKYKTSLDIAHAVEECGGVNNAATGKEEISFYVKHGVSAGNLGFDVLEDMLCHSRFPEEEIEREKNVVLEELRRDLDNPPQLLFKSMFERVFFPNHPLGYPIIGNEETIWSISRNDLLRYQTAYYRPNNMVISVAGNIRGDAIFNEAERRFGSMVPAEISRWAPFDRHQSPGERICLVPRREKEQAGIVLASPAPGYGNEDEYALYVLLALLGGGQSSRLWQDVRETRGLAYGIGTSNVFYQEAGYTITMWGTRNSAIAKSIEVVLAEYKKIREKYIEDGELAFVKKFLIGRREVRFEESDEVAEEYGENELLLGRAVSFEEFKEKINMVTKEDIKRAASAYLGPDDLKIGLVAQERYCKNEMLNDLLMRA
ncbi:MAG: hypothetical protein A2934_05105 [Candidatus Sungbacteria bacterium RIFCSPLOWO2_01_FULL_47_10]|uniref:Peptidase M16 n=1 Tax=Candidatus Sungbacteria bacterium RIFCSPLOWO2_01_FULL_47_10 TaxID=1802276 RepID=A0A1G2L0P7_9BACT|nr:MAG: hypothetical protein A2934_05105 [Candidatus Sungbacteria bacterium RIFCSPLOWO2_01_FULL_47_10]